MTQGLNPRWLQFERAFIYQPPCWIDSSLNSTVAGNLYFTLTFASKGMIIFGSSEETVACSDVEYVDVLHKSFQITVLFTILPPACSTPPQGITFYTVSPRGLCFFLCLALFYNGFNLGCLSGMYTQTEPCSFQLTVAEWQFLCCAGTPHCPPFLM